MLKLLQIARQDFTPVYQQQTHVQSYTQEAKSSSAQNTKFIITRNMTKEEREQLEKLKKKYERSQVCITYKHGIKIILIANNLTAQKDTA